MFMAVTSSKKGDSNVMRAIARAEAQVRTVEAALEDTRWRLAGLEAWTFDKEHAGLSIRVCVQQLASEQFLARDGSWQNSSETALHFDSVLHAVHHCRALKLRGAQFIISVPRTQGVAVIPMQLPGVTS